MGETATTAEMDANLLQNKLTEICSSIPEEMDTDTPQWAKIILISIKGLCEELSKNTSTQSKRIDQLEIRCAGLETKLDEKTRQLSRAIDDQEQYSRRNCLLVHGVPETGNKDEDFDKILADVFRNEDTMNLGIKIEEEVSRAHRLGKLSTYAQRTTRNNKLRTRPIIVRFLSYRWRSQVFFAKKHLKGTGIVITENLTSCRHKLSKATQEKFGFKSVWTIDGRIMANVNNKKVVIDDYSDLK